MYSPTHESQILLPVWSTEILAPTERRVTDHFGPLILDGNSWWGAPRRVDGLMC